MKIKTNQINVLCHACSKIVCARTGDDGLFRHGCIPMVLSQQKRREEMEEEEMDAALKRRDFRRVVEHR